jgi:hypothetical protein
MGLNMKSFAVAGLLSFALANSAFAQYSFPVPEFDGTTGIAAASLLASVVAVLFSGSRK